MYICRYIYPNIHLYIFCPVESIESNRPQLNRIMDARERSRITAAMCAAKICAAQDLYAAPKVCATKIVCKASARTARALALVPFSAHPRI